MKIVIVEGREVGILSMEEMRERTINIAKGVAVDRPDLKLFAVNEAEAARAVELANHVAEQNDQERGDGERLAPIHPGEILLEEFMKPDGISREKMAADLEIPLQALDSIIEGQAPILFQVAERLGKRFGTTKELWLGLQSDYEVRLAKYRREQ